VQPLTKRVFGKVDEYGGELCASTFLHLWFLPIVPTGSLWISAEPVPRGDADDGAEGGGGEATTSAPRAQAIRWQWRSIAAAYLRAWIPLLCVSGFAPDTTIGYFVAAVGLFLFAWSWTWRMAHRPSERLRHDFDLVALGSQCPPEALPATTKDRLLALKQRAFATASERTPEDVARFGGTSTDELLAAYAVLRLVGAQHRPSGPWRALAQRIVDGKRDAVDGEHGAFRSGAAELVEVEALHRYVRAAAAARRARAVLSLASLPQTWLQGVLWGGVQRVLGYAALAVVAFLGAFGLAHVSDPDRYDIVSERRLRDTIGEGQREYRVACEELIPFATAASSGEDGVEVHLCRLGSKLLPVLSEGGEGIRGTVVRGRLLPRSVFSKSQPRWERDLQSSPYDARLTVVYLTTDVFSKAGQIALALVALLGSLLLLGLWERLRRQRASMLADAERVLAARSEAAAS
jgi:hypothetical protein